jgi:multiple sugar transport system permease protein
MTTDTRTPIQEPAFTPAPSVRSRPGLPPNVRAALKHTVLILLALLMLYPLLWMIAGSLRPQDEIFSAPGLFVTNPKFSNYSDGWNALSSPFGRYLFNSFAIVVGSVIGNLVSCSLAAYAFARMEFFGKRLLFAIMLVTIMLPLHVVIVPQYILFSHLGWINTILPLVVPKFLATDAFFIFLMVQFIRTVPRELDEAARIDGCGHPRIFLRIILPLMVPALATTAIFTSIWTWNDFFGQLIYLIDPGKYTVPIALASFIDSTSESSWSSMFAMSVVSLLPVFLGFLFGQRFLLEGIATSGGK